MLNQCPGGGYTRLQVLMLQQEETKCEVCQELLKKCNFAAKELEDMVAESVSGNLKQKEEPRDEDQGDDEDELLSSLGPKKRKMKKERRDPQVEENLCKAYVATLEPVITLLPRGTHDKKVPYKCSVCTSPKWPLGKVGECNQMQLISVQHFIRKHLASPSHIKACQKSEIGEQEENRVSCVGICTGDETGGKFFELREEFHLWASHSNLADHGKHSYSQVENSNDWIVVAEGCKGQVKESEVLDGSRAACACCLDMGRQRSLQRTVQKFWWKYHAALLLSAQLFQGEKATAALKNNMQKSAMYKSIPSQVDQLFKLEAVDLQQIVRQSLLCDSRPSANLQRFIHAVVKPSVQVTLASVPERLAEVSAKMEAIIKGGGASEQDMLDIKTAAAAVSGQMSKHPLLQGLIVSCRTYLEKNDRGITTLRGRKSASESQLERDLVCNAGLQLSIACGNGTLAREFGLAQSSLRVNFHHLAERGLPIPALAPCFPDQLQENWLLADQRYVQERGACRGAFDRNIFGVNFLYKLMFLIFVCMYTAHFGAQCREGWSVRSLIHIDFLQKYFPWMRPYKLISVTR